MPKLHAVVWIDHEQARIIHFDDDAAEEQVVHSPQRPGHLRSKHRTSAGDGRKVEDAGYLHAVALALQGTAQVLLVGPGSEKNEFFKHLEHHDKAVAARVAAIQAADHPTGGQLLALARKYFQAADQMKGL